MGYRLPFPDSTIPTGGTFADRTPPRVVGHRGTDWSFFKGARGAIGSVCRGRVVSRGWSPIVGWWVEVASLEGDGMFWTYCHMASASPLAVGDVVDTGDRVGIVGATGSAARGAHLHLAGSKVRGGGLAAVLSKLVDPHAYIASHSAGTAGGKASPLDDAPVAQEEDEDMPKPIYFIANDNLGLSVGVGREDVWVRPFPGSPLLRMTQGQWTEVNNERTPLEVNKDYFWKSGSWFGLAFAEDNLVRAWNVSAHPWLNPTVTAEVDIDALVAAIDARAVPADADEAAHISETRAELLALKAQIAALPDAVRSNIKAAL